MKVSTTVIKSISVLAFVLFASPVFAQQQSPAPMLQEPPSSQQQQAQRPWLGVTIQEVNERIASQMGIRDPRGVLVADVADGSPADDAGVNLGDIIVRLNGRDVEDASDFITRIQEAGVGSTVALEVSRAGATEEINVTLEPMPSGEIVGRNMPGHGMGQGMMGQGMDMMAMRGPQDCPVHGQAMGAAPCPMCPDCPMHGQMGMGGQCPMGQDCPMMGGACPGGPGSMMGGMGMMHKGPSKGMMGGQMMGRMGAMAGDPMYHRIMMAIKGMNLTPDQKSRAKAIHSDYKKKQIRAMADAKVAHIELHELLAADPVNMDKVRAKVNELTQKKAEMMLTGIRSLEDFKKLLNPEQRKQLSDTLAMDSGGAEAMEGMESAE